MNHEIISLAKQFRLSSLYDGIISVNEDASHEDFILDVLRKEAALRDERTTKEHLKHACFPSFKSFDDFDCSFQKGGLISSR